MKSIIEIVSVTDGPLSAPLVGDIEIETDE